MSRCWLNNARFIYNVWSYTDKRGWERETIDTSTDFSLLNHRERDDAMLHKLGNSSFQPQLLTVQKSRVPETIF